MKLAIRAGRVLTPLEEIADCTVLVEDGRISAVGRDLRAPAGAREIRADHSTAVPGFIDLHIHGAGGADLMDGSPAALETVNGVLARHGTTSYFPTTLTASVPGTTAALTRLADSMRACASPPSRPQAHPLGIHMEGPFLNVIRKGVHPAEHILPPAVETFDQFLNAAGGMLRLITMAPEISGAAALVKHAFARGVRVGMGHSDATFEQAQQAIELGIGHVIHMYNAMRPFSHRDPGLTGAALLDDRLSAELIADGVHVHEPAIRLLLRSKGVERILLITDGLAATGMGDGEYTLGELEIVVKGPLACNRAGVLAGSVLTLDQAVRNMMKFTGAGLQDAARMASLNQAQLMGLENKGRIAAGADADIVLLNAEREVEAVCTRGAWEQFS